MATCVIGIKDAKAITWLIAQKRSKFYQRVGVMPESLFLDRETYMACLINNHLRQHLDSNGNFMGMRLYVVEPWIAKEPKLIVVVV